MEPHPSESDPSQEVNNTRVESALWEVLGDDLPDMNALKGAEEGHHDVQMSMFILLVSCWKMWC